MMRRLILIILTITNTFWLSGQMFPLSDHHTYNSLAINPAYAGCHDALSATVAYYNQWAGFAGAPKSLNLSVHTPFFHDRIGLGLLIEHNTVGIFKETSIMGNYAYRLELLNGKLAFGLGFGLDYYHYGWNELEATDTDDPYLANNRVSSLLPSFSLGAYFYTGTYFLGLSLPRFISYEYDETDGKYRSTNDFSAYNYMIQGGYRLKMRDKMEFLPSLLLKYHPGHNAQVDVYGQLILWEKVWLGMGYRSEDIVIGMLQCQLNSQLRLAYSYDFNLGELGTYNNGSHEIVLNYIFNYKRLVTGPRQF